MSRLPRAAVTTGAAALAIVLAAPSVALACDDGSGGGSRGGDSKSGDQRAQHDSQQKSSEHEGAEHKANSRGGEHERDGKGSDEGKASTKQTGGNGSKHDDGHNPPGNNGTIKIEPFGTTDGNANHPHPGCGFRLQMFNFDDGQTGTITFVGQAPTKGAVTQQPLSGTRLLSDDAAMGGQDVDAFYDVTAASLGLTGTPAKQGWHIKVLVNADDAPGGAKSKVFWLSCPSTAPAAPAGGSTSGGGSTDTTQGTTQGSTQTTTQSLGGGTAVTVPTTSGSTAGGATAPSNGGATTALGQPATGFTGGGGSTVVTSAATAPETVSAARSEGGALPFTGLATGSLLAFALGSLGIGALAVRAGRRRSALGS